VGVATGKIAWRGEAPERGSAAVLYADGHLWFRYDRGLIALIEATPEAFRLKGTFQAVTGDGPAWAYPVIADGRLYLRHGDLLACYDARNR
jgi:prepilin-type processing-associated H-X9-DG protein